MQEILLNIIPTGKAEVLLGGIVSVLGTVTCHFFGAWNVALEALVVAMILDYISGVLAAYINPNLALNSQRGLKGIIKKMMLLMLVVVAHYIGLVLGQEDIVRSAAIFYILGNEGLSIIENLAKAGLPIPPVLKKSLEQLQDKDNKDKK